MHVKQLTIILIFTICKVFAQTDTAKIKTLEPDTTEPPPIQTPYNPNGNYQTFGIKAALWPWLLGNAGGAFLSAGVDYSFLKNQSIGIEATFYGDESQHDGGNAGPNSTQTPQQDYNGGNKAVYVNYRYYFNFKDTRESNGLVFYLGLSARYGQANYTWTPGYTGDSIASSKKTYYSYGALAGLSLKLKHKKHFGFDFNVGTLYNNKTIDNVYAMHPQSIYTHGQFATYDMRISASICWWFYHAKKSKQ